jgi:hypothetical protein
MSDRLIRRDGYSLTIEETNDINILYTMFENMTGRIESAAEFLLQLRFILPGHEGKDFAVVSYYDSFVSPSNLDGYGVLSMLPFPSEKVLNDDLRAYYRDSEDEMLARVLIVTAKNSPSSTHLDNLHQEIEMLLKTRIKHLRML